MKSLVVNILELSWVEIARGLVFLVLGVGSWWISRAVTASRWYKTYKTHMPEIYKEKIEGLELALEDQKKESSTLNTSLHKALHKIDLLNALRLKAGEIIDE